MNNTDLIHKQIKAAKDEIVSTVSCTTDYQTLVDTGMLERLVNDLANLERQLIECDTFKVKKTLIHDIPAGSMYYLQVKRCYEREFLANNFIYGYVHIEQEKRNETAI